MMKLICAACGNEMELEGELQDGDQVQCPFCGEVTACSKPSRIELPSGASRSKPKLHIRHPKSAGVTTSERASELVRQVETRANAKRKRARRVRGWINNVVALVVLAAICFGGYKAYRGSKGDEKTEPLTSVERHEGKIKPSDEEAARRQKSQEEEEQRQAERRRERERKEKALAEARAELARKAEAERTARESYRAAQGAFSGKPSHFAESASKDKIDDPRQANENARFWAVDRTFAEQGGIYEIETGTQGVASVGLRMTDGRLQEVAVDEFVPRLGEGIWAISNGEAVWLFGTGKQIRTVGLPKGDEEVYPMGDELGELDVAVETLRIRLPEVRYRLSLKSKNGDKSIPLGIIQGSERLSLRRAREGVEGEIAERRAKKRLASLGKPKPKKFKKTVVLYDGDVMKKGIDGVTRVPRTFKYLGTSRYDKNYNHVMEIQERAREKWERMRAEAERQERREIEVEAENHAAMEAYKRRCEEARRNVSVSDEDIDEELKKYALLIERSRTKVAEAD